MKASKRSAPSASDVVRSPLFSPISASVLPALPLKTALAADHGDVNRAAHGLFLRRDPFLEHVERDQLAGCLAQLVTRGDLQNTKHRIDERVLLIVANASAQSIEILRNVAGLELAADF